MDGTGTRDDDDGVAQLRLRRCFRQHAPNQPSAVAALCQQESPI